MRHPPKNIRHKPSALDPQVWSDRVHKTKTWVIAKTPQPVLDTLPKPERVRSVVRLTAWSLAALYAVLVAFGIGGAYMREGGAKTRRAELRRAEAQLAQEQARTELLRSRLDALARRDEVRTDAIRRELHRLKKGERFYVFK